MKSVLENLVLFRSGITSSLLKITGFFFIGLFFVPLLLQQTDTVQKFFGTNLLLQSDLETLSLESDVYISNLISAIRKSVRVAAKGSNIDFTDGDRKTWEKYFPCRSRSELRPIYAQRNHVKDIPANIGWQRVLDEYAILHRVCMSKIGDPISYIRSRNESTGCKFVVAEAHFGLGNKLLHMSSVFLYAVLTQRVLLIPRSTSVPPILCEPFAGSSWSMPADVHKTITGNRTTSDQLYAAVDTEMSTNNSKHMGIYASKGGGEWGPEIRFWCDTEQSLFSEVTWLTFDGCLFFLPKLFAIARFRPIVEALFPERIVLPHVLRTVFLPSDTVWERVLATRRDYLDHANKQVGVQVRYNHGESQYRKSNAVVNEHITRCLWENDILPEVCPSGSQLSGATDSKFANCSSLETSNSTLDTSPSPVTKVFVASLFLGFHDHLSAIYERRMHENVRKEIVRTVQLTHEKRQGFGVEVDSQALVEIIALSFSDVLLVTPFSTFGGVAQAYGGLVPFFLQNDMSSKISCERGVTTEPCYLGGLQRYECRYDDAIKQTPVMKVVPYLTQCQRIDVRDDSGLLMRNEQKSFGQLELLL